MRLNLNEVSGSCGHGHAVKPLSKLKASVCSYFRDRSIGTTFLLTGDSLHTNPAPTAKEAFAFTSWLCLTDASVPWPPAGSCLRSATVPPDKLCYREDKRLEIERSSSGRRDIGCIPFLLKLGYAK